MAAEPVWQSNYVDLCDERSIRFGAQCVICDARYATSGESLDQLLVREAIPDSELQQEIKNAQRYIFTEFDSAYNGMLVRCYRCQRPACPDCWDDDNQMCGECVAARGLARSPRRGLPSSNPLSDGRLVRVEPGRHSDAQRPSWLDALIATQPLDEPLGTPPKHPAVKQRPAEEPAHHVLLDAALQGVSSPGASMPNMPFPDRSFPGMSFPDALVLDTPSPGMSSPGMSFPGSSFPDMSSPGVLDRAAQASYPGGAFASELPYGRNAPAMPVASQSGIFPAASAEQFTPFAPPVAQAPSQMAAPARERAAPSVATMVGAGASVASPGNGGSAMVECPRCGTANYDFVTRCTNCQLPLIQDCPHCQQLNPGHATQCEFCGEPLNRAPGWSQIGIPAASPSTERTRKRGEPAPNAMRRQPKVSKDERAGRKSRPAAQGTGETRAAPQKVPGQFEVQGGVLVDYIEAHPIVATLSLWGERLLTAIVVVFVAGLITSIATAELSARANETLRGVLHVDIRQVLAHFIAQMQFLLDRFKR